LQPARRAAATDVDPHANLMQSLTARDIAEQLYIGKRTVGNLCGL